MQLSDILSFHFRRQVLTTTIFAFALGFGMVAGALLRELGLLIGVLILLLGFLYLFREYRRGRGRQDAAGQGSVVS